MSNDAYVRTTSAKHKAVAQALWREAAVRARVRLGLSPNPNPSSNPKQALWRKAAAKGEIYLHYYKGWCYA